VEGRETKQRQKRQDATQNDKKRAEKSGITPHGRRDGGISQSQKSPKHPALPIGVYSIPEFPVCPNESVQIMRVRKKKPERQVRGKKWSKKTESEEKSKRVEK
jgi:hypothetical protein